MTRTFCLNALLVLISINVFPASAQLLDTTNLNVSATSSNTAAATVTAGNANGQIAIVADPVTTGGDLFDVIVTDPAAVVSLQLPNATVVTSANAASLGFTYTTFTNAANVNSLYAGTFNLAGAHTVFLLPPSQVPGTYTVIVNASLATNPVLVMVSFVTSSPVRAGATTTAATYKVGDTVVITGMAFNGTAPIADATMTARIVDTSNLTANPPEIPLVDSGQFDSAAGDGLYTGTYTAAAPGKFLAVVRVTGSAATGNYSRTATASFSVVPPLANFVAFTDTGVDDNSNGKPDRVVVSAALNVQQAGVYQVGISLQGSNGNVLKSSTSGHLNTGNQSVPVSFKSTDIINQIGVNGPYTLRDAALVSVDGIDNPMVDYVDSPGVTAAYLLSSLDPGSVTYFTGQNTVTPVDTNADGKFDILRVQAGVVVPTAGTYSWSASLFNSAGVFVTLYDTSASLAAGSNTLRFDFSGSAIGQACASGVLSVRAALLFGSSTSAFADHLIDTQSFTGAQFTNAACFLTSVTPNSGTLIAGAAQTFTFAYTDSSGSADLASVSTLINSSTAPGSACSVAWFRSDHTIRLYDDFGLGGYTYGPDTSNSFGNSQCTITYNNPIIEAGNSLTMTLSIAFTKSFVGTKNIYMEAQSAGGADTGLQLYGTFGLLPTSPCDINGDGSFTLADVTSAIAQALGAAAPANDLNGDGLVNVVEVQNLSHSVGANVCVTH